MCKKTWMKKVALAGMVTMLTMGCSIPVFAQAEPPADDTSVVAETQQEEQVAETDAVPAEVVEEEETTDAFTDPGNARVQDAIKDGSTKEFYTIQTKNNQTFYLVIDKSGMSNNVYMLSQIDESDLKDFLSDEEQAALEESSKPQIVLPEVEETPETEPVVTEPEKPQNTGVSTAYLLLLLVAAAGIVGYYYFKIYKPRKEFDENDEEGIEIYEDQTTVEEEILGEEDFPDKEEE